jgi:hypothetical protein
MTDQSDCPHCGTLHDRVCRHPNGSIDRTPWTPDERDAWRAQIKRDHPAVEFALSTAQTQARFGDRNRRDREKAASDATDGSK